MKIWVKKAVQGLLIAGALIFLLDRGCVFYHLTGIPCPGCGLTRSYLAAIRFDFVEAFRMHPLWPVTVPVLLWAVWKNGVFFQDCRKNLIFTVLLGLVYIGVYLLRMWLLFPDTPSMQFYDGALIPVLYHRLQEIL